MKITFDHVQENKTHMTRAGEASATGVRHTKGIGHHSGVSGILFGKGHEQQAYGKQPKSMQEVKEQAGLFSGEDYKNYMAVMASTMSGEDFSSLMEEGINPGKTEVGDMVTIMDHIKTVMAKSGVVIEGFNAGGDISMDKLEAMTGNPAYAQAIVSSFAENDIPLTEENISEVMKQSELAMQIDGLSDSVKQYLIENGAELTIDQIYTAKYSVQTGENINTGTGRGNYFADDLSGYYGKTTGTTDMDALSAQIDKIINEAELPVNEETKAEAAWILERGLLLTGENLGKLHQMNHMNIPMSREETLSHIAQAMREGREAKDAELSKDGIYKRAESIKETIDSISPEALQQVMEKGEVLNIRNLSAAQRNMNAAVSVSGEERFVHAQRTLEEVRLQMTVSANIMLLKSDYAIETAELSALVEELRHVEEKMNRTFGLSAPEQKDNELFHDTMAKTAEIRRMPLAVVGRVLDIGQNFTLSRIHEEGHILESAYKRAGESYEALMTAPRADLGDRLQDAFSNIDDILESMDFELTKDNRRAVRILAYNKTEITPENLTAVRAADAQLTALLDRLTPPAALAMIRDGVNPLTESVSDLTEYFMQQEDNLSDSAETFSRFLYRMEKKNEISPDERETYIGIYRLIRQIEKGDGKAVGTVVANGWELTFSNLLSAVRTGQKKSIQATIDDNFGELTDTNVKGTRISDQINRYYETRAAQLLADMDPSVMAQNHVTMETTWDELMEMSLLDEQADDRDADYRKEQLSYLRNQLQAGGEAIEYLVANGQPVTPDNAKAAEKLLKNRGDMFKKAAAEADIMRELEKMPEHFTDAESAQEAYEQMQADIGEKLEESMLTGEMGYLDIRAISSISKQLSLAGSLAKEENYELPAMIDGQMTSVNVRFRHDSVEEKKGSVFITAELTDGEIITAELKVAGDTIRGYMGCDSEERLNQLTSKKEEFIQDILLKTGKNADINFVYSKEIKAVYYDNSLSAGKPEKIQTNYFKAADKESEEVHGRNTSAKELYQAAKSVIDMLKDRA